MTLLLILTLRFRLRNEFKSEQLLKNEIRDIVSNEGLYQRTNIGWQDIIQVYDHPDMFRLYLSKNKAIILTMAFIKQKSMHK